MSDCAWRSSFLVGRYRVEHPPRGRFATQLWQPSATGVVQLIVVPDVALFGPACSIRVAQRTCSGLSREVVLMDSLCSREDGSVVIYAHAGSLAAGMYELALTQINHCGSERREHFVISVIDPAHPPQARAAALR
jgi:hypothetical protein